MAIDESTVGETPLVELDAGVAPTLLGKVEWLNLPGVGHGGGSIKARIAVAMLDAAEAAGHLPGKTILEASSGNTARALARIGAARGYETAFVVPEDLGSGKRAALEAAGATLHEVPAEEGYDALLDRVEELASESGYWHAGQYENAANPRAHEQTGREIWHQTDGAVTAFVAGAGTGGTVTGVGRVLHARNPDVRVVGFEPETEAHGLHGLKYMRGGGYHPDTYDESVIDEKRYLATEPARVAARDLAARYADADLEIVDAGRHDEATIRATLRVDGDFLVGPTGGGGVACVRGLDREGVLDESDTVVVPLCDRGDTYADGELWGDRLS
ncbi:pyridoxal-phosphate dependent enzyme [Halosegnis longus]|uniref:pyridoxal-phosphate dependent enzyme n=1 Tax=Halosegnis longus TaxID=2216012 RepID=UPI00096A359A|nr:pyridoxal-phosphate dependent enzyme [Salella cibi]